MQATGARGKGRQRGKAKAKGNAREAAFTALLCVADGGRDIGLGPFHALGKLLYNKRLAPGSGVRALTSIKRLDMTARS